jgi:hypothetical protein
MINASSGRVRMARYESGISWLTNGSVTLRIWGIAMVSSPSAVRTCLGRVPLREPRACGVRSQRALCKKRGDLVFDTAPDDQPGSHATKLRQPFGVLTQSIC